MTARRRRGRRTSAPPRTIGLYGLFGIDNFGCEATLEAMVRFLRDARPDAELVCICGGPDNVERDHGIAARRIRSEGFVRPWAQAVDRLLLRVPRTVGMLADTLARARRVDLLVVCGGGMLEDYCDRPAGEPLSLFLWCLGARLSRRPVAFVSVGAGPMRNPVSRWLLTSSVRMSRYRSYRDRRAREFMDGIGIGVEGDEVYPDIVFGLHGPDGPVEAAADDGLTVGVTAMLYEGYFPSWVAGGSAADGDEAALGTYLARLAEFVAWLLDEGHRVRLITGQLNDRLAVEGLIAIIESRRGPVPADRLIAEPITSARELMEQIARTDVVVSSRYHNLVSALVLGKPVVAIDPTRKNGGLMADLGFGDLCQEIDDLDVGRLIEQFSQVAGRLQEYEDRIRELNDSMRALLAEQEGVLQSRLLGSPGGGRPSGRSALHGSAGESVPAATEQLTG